MPSRRAASSSSAKNGLPSERASISRLSPGAGRLAEDPGDQLGELATAEPAQLQPFGPPAAVQLGQERPQRMTRVQLVRAAGQHQRHARAEVADQEGEQIAGGLVGPVQILDHQQHRGAFGDAVQHPEQQLEQLRRCQRAARPRRVPRAELRHQPRQLVPGAAQHPLQLGGAQHGGQRAQRLHHRRVGQDALPDVQAAAGERHHPETGGIAGRLSHQPGLAYPRLARDQHGSGLAGCCPLDRRPEPGHLGVAADQHRAGDPLPHTPIIPKLATAPGPALRSSRAVDHADVGGACSGRRPMITPRSALRACRDNRVGGCPIGVRVLPGRDRDLLA